MSSTINPLGGSTLPVAVSGETSAEMEFSTENIIMEGLTGQTQSNQQTAVQKDDPESAPPPPPPPSDDPSPMDLFSGG